MWWARDSHRPGPCPSVRALDASVHPLLFQMPWSFRALQWLHGHWRTVCQHWSPWAPGRWGGALCRPAMCTLASGSSRPIRAAGVCGPSGAQAVTATVLRVCPGVGAGPALHTASEAGPGLPGAGVLAALRAVREPVTSVRSRGHSGWSETCGDGAMCPPHQRKGCGPLALPTAVALLKQLSWGLQGIWVGAWRGPSFPWSALACSSQACCLHIPCSLWEADPTLFWQVTGQRSLLGGRASMSCVPSRWGCCWVVGSPYWERLPPSDVHVRLVLLLRLRCRGSSITRAPCPHACHCRCRSAPRAPRGHVLHGALSGRGSRVWPHLPPGLSLSPPPSFSTGPQPCPRGLDTELRGDRTCWGNCVLRGPSHSLCWEAGRRWWFSTLLRGNVGRCSSSEWAPA